MWLASLGSERIDEVFDSEKAVNRAVEYYRRKGYSDEWIKARLAGIVDRFKLTDIWKSGGITKPVEFALLTNEIYKNWSGMKASEYKQYKGLRKESLRDNMTDIEIALTNISEIAARDIARVERPQGLKENYDEDLIKELDSENVIKILNYLNNNGIYYAKDLLLNSLDLFLFPSDVFIKKFEHLKKVLGNDFIDKLGEDISLIEIMYE